MTPKRKAEVNRRLAEFEGWILHAELCPPNWEEPNRGDWRKWHRSPPDYTTDLNALARLERKLPQHRWEVWILSHKQPLVSARYYDWRDHKKGGFADGLDTEAEARADAICQYLEKKHQR